MRVVGLKSSASLPELEQALTWKSRGKSRGGLEHFLLGMSSSQLTMFFQRGRSTTNLKYV